MANLLLTLVNSEITLRLKGQRSRSLGTKMQNHFCAYLREKCIDLGLHQINTKMICPFYTYHQIHFTSGNA